ncbi:MAG: hypothetical protein AAGB02_03565 [Pseudomonadota bacterium]
MRKEDITPHEMLLQRKINSSGATGSAQRRLECMVNDWIGLQARALSGFFQSRILVVLSEKLVDSWEAVTNKFDGGAAYLITNDDHEEIVVELDAKLVSTAVNWSVSSVIKCGGDSGDMIDRAIASSVALCVAGGLATSEDEDSRAATLPGQVAAMATRVIDLDVSQTTQPWAMVKFRASTESNEPLGEITILTPIENLPKKDSGEETLSQNAEEWCSVRDTVIGDLSIAVHAVIGRQMIDYSELAAIGAGNVLRLTNATADIANLVVNKNGNLKEISAGIVEPVRGMRTIKIDKEKLGSGYVA